MRHRTCQKLKWVGLGTCVVLLGTWVFSLYCVIHYDGPKHRLWLLQGSVVYIHNHVLLTVAVDAPVQLGGNWHAGKLAPPGLLNRRLSRPLDFGRGFTSIPLWLPLALVAIPTAYLWWRDRRVLPNRCSCGYNLTGNISGTCPECGAEI